MELSINLKKLEPLPGAFDILRYLNTREEYVATTDEIMTDLDMSERRFNKAIRRLVTTDYVQMGAQGEYRLTEMGVQAAEELEAYYALAPQLNTNDGKIARRLMVALPRTLAAGQPSRLFVGFHPDPNRSLEAPASVVLRLSALNAQLSKNGDAMMNLDNGSKHEALDIIPGHQSQVRLKVQVFQLAPNGEDITDCGGMYVDVDVTASENDKRMVAYGVNIHFDRVQ